MSANTRHKLCFPTVITSFTCIIMNQNHEHELKDVISKITKLRENKKTKKHGNI